MSENPRDERSTAPGIWIDTDQGRWHQPYLPLCAPDETAGVMRAEVHKFSLLLRSMLRHYHLSLDEAQGAVAQIFKELGR